MVVDTLSPVDWKAIVEAKHPELVRVALCESGGDFNAQNPISTASGLFQFLDGTAKMVHQEVYGEPLDMNHKNDPIIQIEMAFWLYENHGLSQWSVPCGTLQGPPSR